MAELGVIAYRFKTARPLRAVLFMPQIKFFRLKMRLGAVSLPAPAAFGKAQFSGVTRVGTPPVQGRAQVELYQSTPDMQLRAGQVAVNGAFKFNNLKAGRYQVVVRDPDHLPRLFLADVSSPEDPILASAWRILVTSTGRPDELVYLYLLNIRLIGRDGKSMEFLPNDYVVHPTKQSGTNPFVPGSLAYIVIQPSAPGPVYISSQVLTQHGKDKLGSYEIALHPSYGTGSAPRDWKIQHATIDLREDPYIRGLHRIPEEAWETVHEVVGATNWVMNPPRTFIVPEA